MPYKITITKTEEREREKEASRFPLRASQMRELFSRYLIEIDTQNKIMEEMASHSDVFQSTETVETKIYEQVLDDICLYEVIKAANSQPSFPPTP